MQSVGNDKLIVIITVAYTKTMISKINWVELLAGNFKRTNTPTITPNKTLL